MAHTDFSEVLFLPASRASQLVSLVVVALNYPKVRWCWYFASYRLLQIAAYDLEHLWDAQVVGNNYNGIFRWSHVIMVNPVSTLNICQHFFHLGKRWIMFAQVLNLLGITTASAFLQTSCQIDF